MIIFGGTPSLLVYYHFFDYEFGAIYSIKKIKYCATITSE